MTKRDIKRLDKQTKAIARLVGAGVLTPGAAYFLLDSDIRDQIDGKKAGKLPERAFFAFPVDVYRVRDTETQMIEKTDERILYHLNGPPSEGGRSALLAYASELVKVGTELREALDGTYLARRDAEGGRADAE